MLIVVGGGPAGFFAAITARRRRPDRPVVLLERGRRVLRKVAISGGGRCNVTHACFEPRDLVEFYPRGRRELIGAFHRWGPADTATWFADEGVALKTEPDGRMFPTSDRSSTIVTALQQAARRAGVDVRTGCGVDDVAREGRRFRLTLAGGRELAADGLVLATGGSSGGSSGRPAGRPAGGPTSGSTAAPGTASAVGGYGLAAALGHRIVEPVPSLFTFRSDDALLAGLAGISVPAAAVASDVDRWRRTEVGPLLITHAGLSGPAVLRLSSWQARELHACGYDFGLRIDWTGGRGLERTATELAELATAHARRQVAGLAPAALARRLWAALVHSAGLPDGCRWADCGARRQQDLVRILTATEVRITGQSPFTEEFVTCGGVPLEEVDMRTMASLHCPGLFLAGEVLDIDGLTGGFNFQACWTTGRLAGAGLAGKVGR